jgi:hypothetical protein
MPAAPNSPRALERLERWFQTQVLHPRAEARAERRLLPSRSLDASERLAIYQRGYLLRLQECMQADFPSVKQIAGDERFAGLVRGYLERHPSRHWSLNPLGHDFARFLEREAPRGPRIGLLAELAGLEWAMQEVFDAPASETLAADALERAAPGDWGRLRLVPVEALRLLAFEHRCNAIATAARRGEPLPPLGRKRTCVVVYRKDWTVWRLDLDPLQFALLSALCRGRTLGQALAAATRAHRGPRAELPRRVQSACASFVSEGLFRSVR